MHIAFEGIDGNGKSTLAKAVADYLYYNSGHQVYMVREPSRCNLIEDPSKAENSYLLAAYHEDRMNQWHKVSKHILRSGSTLISDRCYLSSLVYQAYDNEVMTNLVLDDIEECSEDENASLQPDHIFIPDTHLEVCADRMEHRGEKVDRKKLRRLQKRYFHLASVSEFISLVPSLITAEELVENYL